MKIQVKLTHIRTLATITAVILAIYAGWSSLTGFFTWLSPFIMLNSVFALKSFVLFNVAGIAVLILIIIRKRFFCRFLCPSGWCCDKISGLSHRAAATHKRFPAISKWLALLSLGASLAGIPLLILLDPMSVFHSFFSAFSGDLRLLTIVSLSGFPLLLVLNYIFPDIWCTKICPLGGLQDMVTEIKARIREFQFKKQSAENKYSPARRFFVASGAGLISGLLFTRFIKAPELNYFRPPASVSPEIFNALCIRCGNCIKVCPSGIISHHADPSGILSWMTPEVNFNNGYCMENCNLCSLTCPTGSITLFSPEAKNMIFMGSAEIIYKDCLLAKNSECDRCKAACSYNAITIEPAGVLLQMKPVIKSEKCVGCGACAVICPERTIRMIPLALS